MVQDGVANVPIASSSAFGAVKVASGSNGLNMSTTGLIRVSSAPETLIKEGSDTYRPIVPGRQDISTFYGLAKAAGVDMASSSNTVGTYTDAAKIAIKTMIGVQEGLEVVRLI